jgi:hypothetical protein
MCVTLGNTGFMHNVRRQEFLNTACLELQTMEKFHKT